MESRKCFILQRETCLCEFELIEPQNRYATPLCLFDCDGVLTTTPSAIQIRVLGIDYQVVF